MTGQTTKLIGTSLPYSVVIYDYTTSQGKVLYIPADRGAELVKLLQSNDAPKRIPIGGRLYKHDDIKDVWEIEVAPWLKDKLVTLKHEHRDMIIQEMVRREKHKSPQLTNEDDVDRQITRYEAHKKSNT